jgi:hypothetical protein
MLIGEGDPNALATGAPTLADFATASVRLEGVETLQVMHELYADGSAALLPPALHPTSPAVVSWLIQRVPESPWGAFQLAQCRIECRSGLRPRGFLSAAVIDDNDAARQALESRWGYRLAAGAIDLRRGYHEIRARVSLSAREVLDVRLESPQLLRASDVYYVANMNAALTPNGLRLVQVDPEWKIERAERGRAVLQRFDADAWLCPSATPSDPITATYTQGAMTLPRLRYVCKPDVLAFQGSERVDASS